MEPTVSVVVSTRDRIGYLQEAVASVTNQTVPNWELVVVDDASTDETQSWLAGLGDPRIRPERLDVHSERGVAFGHGLAAARADLVIFLDDDDRLLPTALSDLSDPLLRDPDAVSSIGGIRSFNNNGQSRKEPHPRSQMKMTMWPLILGGFNVTRGQMMMRRSSAVEVGWDPGLVHSDDLFMALKITLQGPSVIVPRIVLDKRMHVSGSFPQDFAKETLAAREKFVASVSEVDRPTAEDAFAFYREWMKAHSLYHDARNYRSAFGAYLSAARLHRSVAWSRPLSKRMIGALLKSSLGAVPGTHVIADAARRANVRVRRAFKRYPDLPSPTAKGNF